MRDVLVIGGSAVLLCTALIGSGVYLMAQAQNEYRRECRARCHPFAYELWGSKDCVCNKTKEFAP